MNRVALITDISTPLADQLARRYLSEGHAVAATRRPGTQISTPLVSKDEQLLILDWNRGSAISAKNTLLSTLNRFDRIDDTLILGVPELERKLLQETDAEAIEQAVDTWVKGTLFLIAAVLRLYTKRQQGRLALVDYLPQEEAAAPPPLESALRGAFRATAEALAAGVGQKQIMIGGFRSHSPRIEEFADFIVDTMSRSGPRSSGRWHRFPPRSGILSALSQR